MGKDIVALEKEIVVKDEIIQNINAGFNKKVIEQKVKIEGLESFSFRIMYLVIILKFKMDETFQTNV